ncbi:MAG: hypothetical protein WC285_01280 [Candidatus Gracilibacteria bacterium]|jgi:hypothetical protein
MNFPFLKKHMNKRGATIVIGLGLSTLLVIYSVSVSVVAMNTTSNIKAFKNQWQARLAADSIREKLLFAAKTNGAGFSMNEAGCERMVTEVIDSMNVMSTGASGSGGPPVPTVANPSAGRNGECSIEGRNNEPVTTATAGETFFTVPKANTGDAGLDCSPLRKFTNPDMLRMYSGGTSTATASGDSPNYVEILFQNNPLNHPCNWGKLKFGSSLNSKVVVPLYYMRIDATTGNPEPVNPEDAVADRTDPLTTLQIKVRTPCKPVEQRTNCLIETDATVGATSTTVRRINTSDPFCKYQDICKPGDRYQLGDLSEDDIYDPVVAWQISGECTLRNGSAPNMTESCAMAANDEHRSQWDETPGDNNSEITKDFINNISLNNGLGSPITQDSQGEIAYYNKFCNTFTGENCALYTIDNFLNMSQDIPLGDAEGSYTSITKPALQLSIITDELLDENNLRIPYLEYQIVTNTPIANISQDFSVKVIYDGQAFQQNYSVDQNKNIVDFALQD